MSPKRNRIGAAQAALHRSALRFAAAAQSAPHVRRAKVARARLELCLAAQAYNRAVVAWTAPTVTAETTVRALCGICGAPVLARSTTGRPPKYCSGTCYQASRRLGAERRKAKKGVSK